MQSAKVRLRADCGSDHELFVAKFRLKLKKVGETTSPLKYDLNQIPYNYTVEVTNRFKGLDLIYRLDIHTLKNYGQVHDTLQEAMIKTIPEKKEMQKGKMVV